MTARDDSNNTAVTVRVHPTTAARLKELRELMQERTPHGRVSMGDAFAFAVGSASAAIAGGQAPHTMPPVRRDG